MLGFIKKWFLTGLVFLLTLMSVNLLSCISMNNQECKVRPQIVNVNGNDSVFFPFSIKASKCSVSCNNTNNPCAKMCVPHVVKNLNVKLFNLLTWTNKTRRIEWHGKCKCKCRFHSSFCNDKQRCNDDKCRCECKELIDKGVCDKGFIWNPSNCECECYKSCDFSEYLHYKNCNCKKGLVQKLVKRSSAEECTQNFEEARQVEINSTKYNSIENKCKHNSCTLYNVLFSIIFTINTVIGSSFLYFHWNIKKMLFVLSLVPALKQ